MPADLKRSHEETLVGPVSPTMLPSEPPSRKSVTFRAEPEIRYIESPLDQKTRKSPNMARQVFEIFDRHELTDRSRVKLSKTRFRAQCLPDDALCSYVRVSIDDRLAGNVFVCRWSHQGKDVCWITQLVVRSEFRRRGLAAGLLNLLRQDDEVIYGLMSSHPAACLAAANILGSGINNVAVGFIRDNAEAIMKASPISYIKDAELRGSLFDSKDISGVVSSVDTKFFVDHTEPLEALAWVRGGLEWPLGELLDGHEFLLTFEVRRRHRSKSRSASLPQQSGS